MGAFTPLKIELTGSFRRGRPEYHLLEPLTYYDDEAGSVTVPAGYVTDLASVPRFALWFLPSNGRYARAAVIHDWLYEKGGDHSDRLLADTLFLRAMKTLKVKSWRCFLLYWSVRLLGWRSFGRLPAASLEVF